MRVLWKVLVGMFLTLPPAAYVAGAAVGPYEPALPMPPATSTTAPGSERPRPQANTGTPAETQSPTARQARWGDGAATSQQTEPEHSQSLATSPSAQKDRWQDGPTYLPPASEGSGEPLSESGTVSEPSSPDDTETPSDLATESPDYPSDTPSDTPSDSTDEPGSETPGDSTGDWTDDSGEPTDGWSDDSGEPTDGWTDDSGEPTDGWSDDGANGSTSARTSTAIPSETGGGTSSSDAW